MAGNGITQAGAGESSAPSAGLMRTRAKSSCAGMYEQLVERQQNLHDDQDNNVPFHAQGVFGLQQLQLGFHGA
jgi:hypothetical protein